MVFRLQRDLLRLASVLVSVAAVDAIAAIPAVAAAVTAAAALAAAAAVAAAAAAAAAPAIAPAIAATLATLAALAASAAAVAPLLHRHLRPLHRRSECPKLHSLAQLSVELRQRPGVLHHTDCARHWSAPDSDLL